MKLFSLENLEKLSKEQMKTIDGGCTATCGDGFYACCNPDNCKCVHDMGLPMQCEQGGPDIQACMN